MQNSNNNSRKLLNSKKDSLPAAEVQNNANNYRIKKSAASIKKSNSKSHHTNNNNNNHKVNTINSTQNSCSNYNGKTAVANNFQTKLFKSNGYTKQFAANANAIATTAAATPTTAAASAKTTSTTTATIATTRISTSSFAIPQNGNSRLEEKNGLVAKTKAATADSIGSGQSGVNMKSKIILSETFNSKHIDTISLSSHQQQHKQSQNPSSSNNKAKNYSFNGNATGLIAPVERGASGAVVITNKTKKSLTTPTTETTTTLTVEQQSTILAAATTTISASSTKIKATTSLSSSSNGNGIGSNNGGGTNSNNNNNSKNFQLPSDILDDLASRFIINVPDMELNNLIRICFQIELAHWFYLDFFCTGTDEETKSLQPVGMKYFATQLFQHIPFLSQHLPTIDSVLEDFKNYKLAVPTFGAILISEDLQFCLLVQSYFAKSSWGFPKGKVNETEDPEHCATREVFEETGYDITELLVPKDYIEAVINDQYTRLYIVCNVSLDTVFEPRTRNEIRCCVWFPIDSLPNNKNDAISKAKLGQNANSFFMILPFVKRLKKWVNEKRIQAGIIDSSNGGAGGGVVGVGGGLGLGSGSCGKSNDRRKYSTNGCQNNAALANGALLKSPSLGYVGGAGGGVGVNGETHFNNLHRSNAVSNTNSGKKNRQQQQQKNIMSSSNNANNVKGNNVAGCFELSEIETTFVVAGANAVAASAAANARSKRQRHKSMGDLDNMNAYNNCKNPNSCNKNIYNNSNNSNNINNNNGNCTNNKRNLVQKTNIPPGNDGHHHHNDNATHSSGSRRQLFHSQSQNDSVVISDSNKAADQITTRSFSLIHPEHQRQQQHQHQCSMEHIKYVQQQKQQMPDMVQYFAESVSISDEQDRKHIRQRAKSQSEKAVTQQQFQLQAINDCYFTNNNNNNNSSNNIATTSRPNLQRQNSLISSTTTSTIVTTTSTKTSNIVVNTADIQQIGDNNENKGEKCNVDNIVAGGELLIYDDRKLLGQQQQQQRHRRYTTTTAPTLTGNDLIAWNAARTPVAAAVGDQRNMVKAVVEASTIETRLIQQQKLMRQLEEVKKQKSETFPFMLTTPKQQPQQNPEQQQQQVSATQQHRHPLQHSASSPGLATWKNFSFTKNLISNVFL